MYSGGLGFSNSEIIPEEICFHPAIMCLVGLGTVQKSCGSVVGLTLYRPEHLRWCHPNVQPNSKTNAQAYQGCCWENTFRRCSLTVPFCTGHLQTEESPARDKKMTRTSPPTPLVSLCTAKASELMLPWGRKDHQSPNAAFGMRWVGFRTGDRGNSSEWQWWGPWWPWGHSSGMDA